VAKATLHLGLGFDYHANPENILNLLAQLLNSLEKDSAVLVHVLQSKGSVPREPGTWMAVFEHQLVGTIGGGQFEHQAIGLAKEALRNPSLALPQNQRVALGPSLGQCCGGALALGYERVSRQDAPRLQAQLALKTHPLALFGGGHVGQALVKILSDLPFHLHWIDSRDEVFPLDTPSHVVCEHSSPVQAAVADLTPGSAVLIMSFSHAEDLDVVSACLKRQRERSDLPFIGLIGSATKWATFQHRLEDKGFGPSDFARITCPIGLPGINGKSPTEIAVAVAAQLLLKLKLKD